MHRIIEDYKLIIFDWEGTLAEFSHPVDKLFPETRQLLDLLISKDKLLAIATGKSRESLEKTLLAHDLVHTFDIIATASNFPNKPEPAMLSYAINELSILPKQAIMVGDSLVDVIAANAAGIDVCLVNRSMIEHNLNPKFELKDLYLN